MLISATTEDINAVTDLAMGLWPAHEPGDRQEELEKAISDPAALVALCIQAGTPVAFAQCQLRNDYVEGTDSSPVGYLEGIYVRQSDRRKGIASELLRYCQRWAKEKGCTEFASDCEMQNLESYRFHIAAGFLEVNRVICFCKRI